MMNFPRPLSPGDRVALVCPSSPLASGALEAAIAAVAAMGLRPVVYPSCLRENRLGYLAAPDAGRAADLNAAFADDAVRGVLCCRGGYGAARLLPLLDFPLIAAHPKVFLGYSDVTALHTAITRCCGFVTFHAPMPARWGEADPYTLSQVRAALFGFPAGPLPLPDGTVLTALGAGRAQGPLTGGNLTLLADSLGTPWELCTKGSLLFLEDVDAPLHRIDAALTALGHAGKLDACAALLLGAFTNCGPGDDPVAEEPLPLQDILRQLLPPGKPILTGLPCGHTLPTMSLPLGACLAVDAGRGTLEVLS